MDKHASIYIYNSFVKRYIENIDREIKFEKKINYKIIENYKLNSNVICINLLVR